jgi:hypothetical protein
MSKLYTIREKLRNGELKIKRRECHKSNVWKRFGELVKEDDGSASYVMCDDCEGYTNSTRWGLPIVL